MTNDEIRKRIDYLYKKTEEELDPCIFVLNPKMREYELEIEGLRRQCQHHFVNGQCQYCDEIKSK